MRDIEVRHGSPSAEDLAAVVVALSPVALADEAAAERGPSTPAWARAALLQGVGGAVPRTPAELRRRPG